MLAGSGIIIYLYVISVGYPSALQANIAFCPSSAVVSSGLREITGGAVKNTFIIELI